MGSAPVQRRSAVLVVEDDPLIMLEAVDMVTAAGFEATEAKNADEAIRILESRNDIRIVFTDIEMPGSMDGLKLAHAVRHRWPPIQLIVTSGYRILEQSDLPAGSRFFGKPYDHLQISRALQALAA